MKNKQRHHFILIVAMIMAIFGMTKTGLAATANPTTDNHGSIVIDTTNDIDLSHQQFQAYQMFTAEKLSDKEEKYTILPAWQTFMDEVTHQKNCTSEDAYNFLSKLKYNPGKLNQFADAAYKYAQEHGIKPVGTAQPSSNSCTISGLPYGYYLVVDATNSTDKVVVSKDMLVTVDSPIAVHITLKADTPTLVKTINGTKVTGNYRIGQKIPFTLMMKIPSMDGYDKYSLTLNDTLGKGLTFNNDLKITIDGKDYTNYELESSNQKITLKFAKSDNYDAKQDSMLASNTGKLIKIIYTATLNENAVLGGSGNTNIANLTYTNNPYSQQSTHTTPDSKVTVYTYGLDITKQNSQGTKLQGATFELKDKSGNIVNVKQLNNGHYVVDPNGSEGNNIVTDVNGKIKINGLNDGNYQLIEIKAPDGYNKLKAPLQFSIVPTIGGKDFQTLTNLNVEGQDKAKFTANKDSGLISTTIVNTTGGLLPKTGGRGIIILSIIGLLCIALATAIMIRRRKAAK